MSFVQLIPTLLSVLIFVAHLVRNGMFLFAIPIVVMPLLLFVRQGWIARLFQIFLSFAALQFVLTGALIANERAKAGGPWIRVMVIMGGVALFALFAAALFETDRMHERYPRKLRI